MSTDNTDSEEPQERPSMISLEPGTISLEHAVFVLLGAIIALGTLIHLYRLFLG